MDIYFEDIYPKKLFDREEELLQNELLKYNLLFQFEKDILANTKKRNEELIAENEKIEKEFSRNELEENISIIQKLMDQLTTENISMQHKIKSINCKLSELK